MPDENEPDLQFYTFFPFIYQGTFLPFFAFIDMLLELLKVSFILKIFLIEFKDKTSEFYLETQSAAMCNLLLNL